MAQYKTSPDERYTTHLSKQMDPLYEYYNETLEILEKTKWTKRDGFKSLHFISHLCLTQDILTVFNISLSTFQRAQNYRGYVEICDKAQHAKLDKYEKELKKFDKMVKEFENKQDLNIISDYIESSASFPVMYSHFNEIVENGIFKGTPVIFDLDLKQMQKQKWKKCDNDNKFEDESDEDSELYGYDDLIVPNVFLMNDYGSDSSDDDHVNHIVYQMKDY